jgi:uncharacterized membrane protein
MIKENMKGVKQLKKKDNQRIINLVDRAKQNDPRLARAIQAEKDAKQAIKEVCLCFLFCMCVCMCFLFCMCVCMCFLFCICVCVCACVCVFLILYMCVCVFFILYICVCMCGLGEGGGGLTDLCVKYNLNEINNIQIHT